MHLLPNAKEAQKGISVLLLNFYLNLITNVMLWANSAVLLWSGSCTELWMYALSIHSHCVSSRKLWMKIQSFQCCCILMFCCIQKEKITSHPPLKKLKSLNDLDQASDDQEIEFLKLQVLEQQSMIDELTRVSTSQKHEPEITAVSTEHLSIVSFLCMFQDREKLLRKKRHKRSRPIKVRTVLKRVIFSASYIFIQSWKFEISHKTQIHCVQENKIFTFWETGTKYQ